jgi:hypothetical protein
VSDATEVRQDYLPTLRVSYDTGVMVDAQDMSDLSVLGADGKPLVLVLPYGEHDTLNGRELAAVIDSLSITRDKIRAEGRDTPTIDSALEKVGRLVTPVTRGVRVIALERP